MIYPSDDHGGFEAEAARQRGYAGGQQCRRCDSVVGVADYYCRWCGASLREGSR